MADRVDGSGAPGAVCKTVPSGLSRWRGPRLGLILTVPIAFQDLAFQDLAVTTFLRFPDRETFTPNVSIACVSAGNDSEPIKARRIRVAFDANK
jgi:hypothetical protein